MKANWSANCLKNPAPFVNVTRSASAAFLGATAKVTFPVFLQSSKIIGMDSPNPDQATELARSYLKQLGSTENGIQKPNVQAWLEVERRLQLSGPESKAENKPAPARVQASDAPKKAQSIWKRPISELWR